MIYAEIFGPLLAVWALAVWHLSNPANRAEAMPPPPSKLLVEMRVMIRDIKELNRMLAEAFIPVVEYATAQFKQLAKALQEAGAEL